MPEDYKKANVIPIFKKSKKRDAGNYRPVSFSSFLERGWHSSAWRPSLSMWNRNR